MTGLRVHWALGALLLFGTLHVSTGAGGSVSNKNSPKINKGKLVMLEASAPAKQADGTSLNPSSKVHPLVAAYMEMGDNNAFDIHAAVSLDEGATWKSKNLSNSAKNLKIFSGSCFTEAGGNGGDDHDQGGAGEAVRRVADEVTSFEYPGDTFKPQLIAKGNLILVAWTSKDCTGGVDPLNGLDVTDKADKYQVKGRHGCHDYSGEVPGVPNADFPFGLLVPFSCLWAARGIVNTTSGDVTWTKPERITSGRRDAFQLVAATNGKAWALAWQEDPKGLRTGEAAGPGEGMSGATVNHKTDIWYSYLDNAQFNKCGATGPCVQPDDENLPTVTTRFSSPVRVTDNAPCKADGSGGPYCETYCSNNQIMVVDNVEWCTSDQGYTLNGDTGASRPIMFLLPNEMNGTQVVLAYEESKGQGKGEEGTPEDREDWGKNVFYHHFPEYSKPEEIKHGTMLNLPELASFNGAPLLTTDGEYKTYNARRVRLVVQSPDKMGSARIGVVALWREGPEGHGKNADIMMRRLIGGYGPEQIECNKWSKHPITNEKVCVGGVQNLSKKKNVYQETQVSPYDDARAHRGFLHGDRLVVAYTWTEDWGRVGGNLQRYDLYIRRSFDGGKKWTNMYGQIEEPVNLTNMGTEGNKGWSIMEPRLLATPGTMGGTKPSPDDIQNSMVYFVAWGTTRRPVGENGSRRQLQEGDDEEKPTGKDIPMDLFWTMTDNLGESYKKVWNDKVNKTEYPWTAKTKGDDDMSEFGAIQIRTNPAGTKFFATFEANVPSIEATVPSNVFSEEVDGGPCRGNGVGSAVCFNSTTMNPLARYDIDGDLIPLTDEDRKKLQTESSNGIHRNATYDLNDDGKSTNRDMQLFDMACQELKAQCSRRRLKHLRGRE